MLRMLPPFDGVNDGVDYGGQKFANMMPFGVMLIGMLATDALSHLNEDVEVAFDRRRNH
jgi:hypothetical protein